MANARERAQREPTETPNFFRASTVGPPLSARHARERRRERKDRQTRGKETNSEAQDHEEAVRNRLDISWSSNHCR